VIGALLKQVPYCRLRAERRRRDRRSRQPLLIINAPSYTNFALAVWLAVDHARGNNKGNIENGRWQKKTHHHESLGMRDIRDRAGAKALRSHSDYADMKELLGDLAGSDTAWLDSCIKQARFELTGFVE
jgi:hypothetical protein